MANYNKIVRKNVQQDSNTIKISEEITKNDLANYNDDTFLNSVNISFNNNKYVNAMFINQIKDKEYSDLYLSDNIKYDNINACFKAIDKTKNAIYYSVERCTDEDYNSDLNNFFLIVDQNIPNGCDIIYYLITDDNRKFIIKPNNTIPLELKVPCKRFKLSAKMSCNGIDTPSINAFAILYFDQYIQDAYRLINPDLSGGNNNDDDTDDDGNDIITLIRDNTRDDKLTMVSTSSTRIKLIYDSEKDRLSKVQVIDANNGTIVETDSLIYEDYTNSNNETEEVLTKVKIKRV